MFKLVFCPLWRLALCREVGVGSLGLDLGLAGGGSSLRGAPVVGAEGYVEELYRHLHQ